MKNRNQEAAIPRHGFRGFGSETEASALTGFSIRTLQKDRLLGRNRFPWYKVGGKVLYDLSEIEEIVRATRNGAAA